MVGSFDVPAKRGVFLCHRRASRHILGCRLCQVGSAGSVAAVETYCGVGAVQAVGCAIGGTPLTVRHWVHVLQR